MVLPQFWTLEKPIMTFQLDTSYMSSIDASHLCKFQDPNSASAESGKNRQKRSTISRPWIPLPWHAHAAEAPATSIHHGTLEATCLRPKCSHLPCDHGPGTTPESFAIPLVISFCTAKKKSLYKKLHGKRRKIHPLWLKSIPGVKVRPDAILQNIPSLQRPPPTCLAHRTNNPPIIFIHSSSLTFARDLSEKIRD